MRFGILGPLEVAGDDGVQRTLSAARLRRLLLALLVWRDEPVSADRLAEIVWPDASLPANPVKALRTYVSRLRHVVEPDRVGGRAAVLMGDADRYTLRLTGHELDADAFERDVARAADAADEPSEALRHLERALGRWRGPALMEVADEHWAVPEVVRLEELRLAAVEQRFECLIGMGRHRDSVGDLERYVMEHPLRERPHGLLMLALDGSGRAADATAVYHEFRTRLADETGLDPSEDLTRLHDALLAGSAASTFAHVVLTGVWNDLPAARTALIGRDRDVAAVSDLVGSHALVTITGVGGVGKTRLAIEVAATRRSCGEDVTFVDLGRVTDAGDVAEAFFAALRLPADTRADGELALVRILRTKRAVVVVDNCEHVVDAAAAVVDRLLRGCPDLTVLATSREPLGVEGERVYRLRSLSTTAGVALFRDRAADADAAQVPADGDTDAIAAICRRLDGIPLAIVLAATRTAHMSVAEIAARLDERFWLLTGGQRSLPRQQTLRATIDWSYDLLSDEERQALRAAAVFVGGFDIHALAAVAGRSEHVTLDAVASLVDRSLVEPVANTTPTRYRLLETVRLYALDRLRESGEAAQRRQAQAEHSLAQALAHAPRIRDLPPGSGQTTMCRIRITPLSPDAEPHLGNYLAALDWFERQGNLTAVGQLAARLVTVLGHRGFLDAHRRYLARDDVAAALGDGPERALYETASALHASYFADWAEALRFGQAGMLSAQDAATRAAATALTAKASLAFDHGRVPELVDLGLRDLPDDAHYTGLLLRAQLTLALVVEGRLREAVERLAEHARGGDAFAAAEQRLLLHVLGDDAAALAVVPPPRAEAEHEALWHYRWPLVEAVVAAAAGRHADAAKHLLDSAAEAVALPLRLADIDVLLGCAAQAHHAGDHVAAARLLAVTRKHLISPAAGVFWAHYVERVKPHLDEDKRHVIVEAARELDPGDVLALEMERLASIRGG